jgi:hypothetical protein
MDKITETLIQFLESKEICYEKSFNTQRKAINGALHSVNFQAMSSSHEGQDIDIIIEVSVNDGMIYFTAMPRAVYSKDCEYGMGLLAYKWSKIKMPTKLFIGEDYESVGIGNLNFSVFMTAYSPSEGLSGELWQKYINCLIESADTAWTAMDEASEITPD